MKGKNNTYRPEPGTRCLISGANMDDINGYAFTEAEILWRNDKFVLYGNEGYYPNLNRWDHIIAKPLDEQPPCEEDTMGEIKPNQVEELIKVGKLHFGDLLEFSRDVEFSEPLRKDFVGMSFGHFFTKDGPFKFARFPRPDLRAGDPVFTKTESGFWMREHFIKFSDSGEILTYVRGRSNWSGNDKMQIWRSEWRIPTKYELHEAGLDPDWYKGRRGING